jgi:hypothetical protein
MHTEHSSIDDSGQRKVIKHFTAVSPNIRAAVFPLTLVVETINLRDLARLVVATNKGYAVWVPDLETEQKEKGFDTIEATVHKVTYDENKYLRRQQKTSETHP